MKEYVYVINGVRTMAGKSSPYAIVKCDTKEMFDNLALMMDRFAAKKPVFSGGNGEIIAYRCPVCKYVFPKQIIIAEIAGNVSIGQM